MRSDTFVAFGNQFVDRQTDRRTEGQIIFIYSYHLVSISYLVQDTIETNANTLPKRKIPVQIMI